jgi:hypothetical protein
MQQEMLTNKRMAMVVITVQLALLTGLLLYGNIVIAAGAVMSFLLAAAVWRFGFLIKPVITKQMGVIEGFGRYEIPPSQDVIIRKDGNRYFATAYLLVRFTHSSTEKSPEQIALVRQAYERALSSLNYVYRISNMICPVDLSEHVDKIKERRSNCETHLSELVGLPASANQGAQMAHLKREIEACENQLDRIQSGERPMKVLNFAMTTASSASVDDAISKVRQQAAELKTVVASSLDTEVMQLSGDDMKRCFEWDLSLPGRNETDDFLY